MNTYLKHHLIISTIFIFFLSFQTLPKTLAGESEWNVGIQVGTTIPTEDAGDLLDDDISLGISVEYMAYPTLGCRIVYVHDKFQTDLSEKSFEINSFSVLALAAYSFSDRFRVFAMIGPTYFSADNQEILGLGSDGEDIGWSGGAGFDFFPVPKWGIRMQSVYNSALIGTGSPRVSWVDTTIGLSFYL